MITVIIDEITPCLRDVETGDIVETEVLQITRKSFLKKFNAKPIGILHPFHFLIADEAAVRIVEEYNYEWSNDEL